MFNLLYGSNILDLNSLFINQEAFYGSGTVGNVYVKYFLHNVNLPLVVTFSNAGEVTTKKNLTDKNYAPWGFDFVKNYEVNVISFSAIGSANWYRHQEFQDFIIQLSRKITFFKIKLGYGGSMGGYGVSAYSKSLCLTKLLLMNPISTLSTELVPWEIRFESGKKQNWKDNFLDGANTDAKCTIVYDPLFNLDALHARRYKNKVDLKLPGVGHGIPKHLANLGVLKLVFESFLFDQLNICHFNKLVKSRRYYDGYYKWMLSNKNTHLTAKRAEVIKRHSKFIPKSVEPVLPVMTVNDIDLLRDTAIKVEKLNINLAYKIMLLAYKFRPTGKEIKNYLNKYNK